MGAAGEQQGFLPQVRGHLDSRSPFSVLPTSPWSCTSWMGFHPPTHAWVPSDIAGASLVGGLGGLREPRPSSWIVVPSRLTGVVPRWKGLRRWGWGRVPPLAGVPRHLLAGPPSEHREWEESP